MTLLKICENCDNDAHIDGLCKDCEIVRLEAKVDFVINVCIGIAARNNDMVDEYEKKIKAKDAEIDSMREVIKSAHKDKVTLRESGDAGFWDECDDPVELKLKELKETKQ